MFEHFVASARAVVADARAQARRLGHPWVGTEHLLLALAASATPAGDVLRRAGCGPASVEAAICRHTAPPALEADRDALAALGIDLDRVRESVESTFGPGALAAVAARGCRQRRGWRRRRRSRAGGRSGPARPARGAFSPRAKKCLELSLREALRLRHRSITSEHLALGILREGEGMACRVLADGGVDFAALRADLERAVGCPSA